MPPIRIHLEVAHCNGCGSCVEGCPMDVLVLEEERAKVSALEECIACKYCETVCQAGLIRVEE